MEATQVILKRLVEHGEVKSSDFEIKSTPVSKDIDDGQVLVQLIYASVDPYLRSRMKSGESYVPPFVPGKSPDSRCVAKVIASKRSGFSEGDYVAVGLPWQSYVVLPPDAQIQKLDNKYNVPLSYFVGTLGMPGFTAYGSLARIGEPKAGETVFVSAAAGAVGQVVGQLCKNVYGCTVIGSAGTDEKVKFLLEEAGFDFAFNYKTRSVQDALKEYATKGIDVYFDNVGGETLETTIDFCNTFARIICCGAISQYNKKRDEAYGVRNLFLLVAKRIKAQGFIVGDWYGTDTYYKFVEDMPKWVSEGKIKVLEDVVDGIENIGNAFIRMMAGENHGKQVVKCGDDPFRK